jgi:hypothetical protein
MVLLTPQQLNSSTAQQLNSSTAQQLNSSTAPPVICSMCRRLLSLLALFLVAGAAFGQTESSYGEEVSVRM